MGHGYGGFQPPYASPFRRYRLGRYAAFFVAVSAFGRNTRQIFFSAHSVHAPNNPACIRARLALKTHPVFMPSLKDGLIILARCAQIQGLCLCGDSAAFRSRFGEFERVSVSLGFPETFPDFDHVHLYDAYERVNGVCKLKYRHSGAVFYLHVNPVHAVTISSGQFPCGEFCHDIF